MARIQWIRIATDIFENRKIRQIECMPEGDTIIVIWIHLLCLAGTTNDNGAVYFTADCPYTDEMLAREVDRPIITLRLALQTFQKFGMIEIDAKGYIYIMNWEKYQKTEGLEKVKEQNRIRKQRQRDREKLLLCGENDECHVTRHVTSRDRHATEEDKEEDKDIEYTPPIVPPKGETHYAPQEKESIHSVPPYNPPKGGEKKAYGSGKNIWLTDAEYNSLLEEFSQARAKADRQVPQRLSSRVSVQV